MRLFACIVAVVIIGNGVSFLAQAQPAPVNIFEPRIPQTRKTKSATTSETESPSRSSGTVSQSMGSSRSTKRFSSEIENVPVAPEKISLNVEGVIWGTIVPKAIIDGDIYSEGDRVIIDAGKKEAPISDAVIRKIDKLGVHVEYAGRMYTVDVVDKPSSKKKNKKK
ncbi:MAG: hypothetical protein JXD21_05590 [Candidatus Omnitrophica bacterium]|nr:hypothetical protein [Candidatus Omnitrophota bacterium]